MATFKGWSEDCQRFFIGLELDNSKKYFEANRRTYEDSVKGPMVALLESLEADFGPGKVFRANRDIRFSKDKSPYKTNIGALVGSGYIQLSARGLAVGDGMYAMTPGQLERYREAVASDGAGGQLERVILAVEKHGISVNGHNSLKTAPRGYPADHERIELLRHKGLIAWREWPIEPWLGTAEARKHIAGFLVASRPLSTWLDTHVGPSTAEAPIT